MSEIEIRDLKKTFDTKSVLNGVSMTVYPGDIYGFLGPNGSGKTTTLRILLGILSPDEGNITVLGMDPVKDGAKLRRKVNALPESHGLYGWMGAINYLNFFSRLYGMDHNDDDYRNRLQQVGLNPDDIRPVRTYSRGMKQRLGIARAMINNPDVLFLDEPTNGLDPRGRREIHDLLLKLNRENNLTVIISTHILDDVERLCNRIAILDKGKVQYQANLADKKHEAIQYRFRVENIEAVSSTWNFPDIILLEKNDSWVTCLLKGISPAEAIKTLVLSGLSISEAIEVSGGIEELYLQYTAGGAK
jgi:ABC-2 type transport system ATP-binding protein